MWGKEKEKAHRGAGARITSHSISAESQDEEAHDEVTELHGCRFGILRRIPFFLFWEEGRLCCQQRRRTDKDIEARWGMID